VKQFFGNLTSRNETVNSAADRQRPDGDPAMEGGRVDEIRVHQRALRVHSAGWNDRGHQPADRQFPEEPRGLRFFFVLEGNRIAALEIIP
jgi:hypothetical protein